LNLGFPGSNEPRHVRGFAFPGFEIAPGTTQVLLLGIGIGILYAIAIAMSQSGGVQGDETYHYAQIQLFLRGDFRVLSQYLTTIPGYHAAVAAGLWLSGTDSLGAARTLTALFGLVAAAGFHSLRRSLWPGTEALATAQFLALPILAPLFFLVYTDVLALALLLWALVASNAGRHGWSALALVGILLVRQNEIVWAGFAAMLGAWPMLRTRGLPATREIVTRLWPYALPMLAFCAFWIANGTISLSHEQAVMHPLTLRLGNPYFALLLAGLLLPLHAIAGLRDFASSVRKRPWLLALPLSVFALYWWGFHADNPYNLVAPDVYPRNGLLLHLEHDVMWRAGAGIVIVLAVCGLAPTRLRPPAAVWLYPFAALFLASSWLIEQRYALVPLALWLAFREQRSRAIEYVTLALWLAAAVCIFLAVHAGRISL
jgi:alpha-1,2-glucosyltransferase